MDRSLSTAASMAKLRSRSTSSGLAMAARCMAVVVVCGCAEGSSERRLVHWREGKERKVHRGEDGGEEAEEAL
jgi:hypothetical protein